MALPESTEDWWAHHGYRPWEKNGRKTVDRNPPPIHKAESRLEHGKPKPALVCMADVSRKNWRYRVTTRWERVTCPVCLRGRTDP